MPAVEGEAADELHVEVPHVQDAAARLAHDGEGLGQEVVERLAAVLATPLPLRRRRNSSVLAWSCASRAGADGRLELDDALDERAGWP